jgi:NAD(P)-dependent dehydrogenase (short-subunit alcohol dehydrogenase family)
MFDLTGLKVVITGSVHRTAGTIAREMARRGCDIALLGQNTDKHPELLGAIAGQQDRVRNFPTDLSSEREVTRTFHELELAWGAIHLLVNNAELFEDAFILDITEDQWDRIMRANLKPVFLCSKAVIPSMIRQKKGRIINVASLSGKGSLQSAGVHYAASKAGVLGFTRELAKQLAAHNITVNALAPIVTEGLDAVDRLETLADRLMPRIPLRRLGTAVDIANAVAFLASEEAGFITGETLDLSGGLYKY